MRRITALMLAVVVMAALSLTALAENTVVTTDEWVYESADGSGYQVNACYLEDADIALPAQYDGSPVVAVGAHAFMGSDTLRAFTASAPLQSIGDYAFTDAAALTSVTLPATLTELGEGAFSGAESLSEVNLGDTALTAVKAYTFMDTALTAVTLPDSCASIGEGAFMNCSSLTEISIPVTVTEIGADAFKGCEGLKILAPTGSAAAKYAEANGIEWESTGPETYFKGDADGDRKVTIIDATRIQMLLADIAVADPDGIRLRGDVNGGGLDILDATAIQRFLADMGNEHGIGEVVELSPAE